jgi:hypothetical protein
MVVTDVDGVVLWRDGCKARRSGDAAVESVVESKDLFAEVGPRSQRCQVRGQCW